MYNGSSRLLTGGMEGCPPPEMQTCFEGSNCRGNVYNECELLVFFNLSIFFAFLTVILMLLTYQVINCRKFCQKSKDVNLISTVIHLPIIAFIFVGLIISSDNFVFLYGKNVEKSKIFYILSLEKQSYILINHFTVPSIIVNVFTNSILQGFIWYKNQDVSDNDNDNSNVVIAEQQLQQRQQQQEESIRRYSRFCELQQFMKCYKFLIVCIFIISLIIMILFVECAPPILAFVTFILFLILNSYLVMKLVIKNGRRNNNNNSNNIPITNFSLTFIHIMSTICLLYGISESINETSTCKTQNRNDLVFVGSFIVGLNVMLSWHSLNRLLTSKYIRIIYFCKYEQYNYRQSSSRSGRRRQPKIELLKIDLAMIDENMPKYYMNHEKDKLQMKNKGSCSICLESLAGKYVRTLLCDHTYCSLCIENWFLMESNYINHCCCPLCKSKLIWNFDYEHTRKLNPNLNLNYLKKNKIQNNNNNNNIDDNNNNNNNDIDGEGECIELITVMQEEEEGSYDTTSDNDNNI